MNETIQTIIEWSAATFPDATVHGQIKKFKEEKEEWRTSKWPVNPTLRAGDISELADMFIVAAGLGRLDPFESMFCMQTVAKELEESIFATRDLRAAVNAKMAINRARRWRSKKGQYKHEKDEK